MQSDYLKVSNERGVNEQGVERTMSGRGTLNGDGDEDGNEEANRSERARQRMRRRTRKLKLSRKAGDTSHVIV